MKTWVYDLNCNEMLNVKDEKYTLEGNEIFLVERKHVDRLTKRLEEWLLRPSLSKEPITKYQIKEILEEYKK